MSKYLEGLGLAGKYGASGLGSDFLGSKPTTPDNYVTDKPVEVPKPEVNTGFLSGLGGWLEKNSTAVNAGVGAAGIGLGYLSFLDNQKTAGKQRQLLDQQITNNKESMANRRSVISGLERVRGS